MTTTEIDLPSTRVAAAKQAEWIGQATAVEQARAVAEVQAAIVVAQQCPRSLDDAVRQMRESCIQKALADRAFFRYSRGESQISGESVVLARELARCWGNIQYGIAELRRDDDAGVSEMQAFAWDVQTNARNSNTFVVPHARDTKQGRKPLVDLRDVYENNANMGARRVREAIFAVLPAWFVEEAKDLCTRTLADGGGKPLAQQIADTIASFEDAHGITKGQLEEKIGRKADKWIAQDIAQLRVIWQSLRRGEVNKDDEFPAETKRVTAADITGGKQEPERPAAAPVEDPPAEPAGWDK